MNEIIYVWEEKKLLELWDDLDKIQMVGEEFKTHYTGTFFLEETIPFGRKTESRKVNKNSIFSEKLDKTYFAEL